MRKEEADICELGHNKAIRVLEECLSSVGMKASAKKEGYPQVWARDSMITLLGASLVNDKKIRNSLKLSFQNLAKKQTSLGAIPNNVEVESKKPNFQAYADGGLWFIIGNYFFFKQTKDKKFLKNYYLIIKKILNWYDYQDVDKSGLISIQEASDWEDLFAIRGKGLYVNILHYLALFNAGKISKDLGDTNQSKIYLKKATEKKKLINKYFWYRGENDPLEHTKLSFGAEAFNNDDFYSPGRRGKLPGKKFLRKEKYYLPYITFRGYGEWFDSFGNLLAILSGVADKKQANAILGFIEKHRVANPFPVKAIYPVIFPGQKDWRIYYRFGNLNLPHQYHNGGIWPFLGGFYVAALIKMKRYSKAKKALELLALLNKKGKFSDWEFNEWFHGRTGKPRGMAGQAWSAGMYVYAYESVRDKRAKFF